MVKLLGFMVVCCFSVEPGFRWLSVLIDLWWQGFGGFSVLYWKMQLAAHDLDINSSSYLLGCPFRERSIKHYSNFHQILLVGEGDFTFSSALANAFGFAENIVSNISSLFFMFCFDLFYPIYLFVFLLVYCFCDSVPIFMPLIQRRCYSHINQPKKHCRIWRSLEKWYCTRLMQEQWRSTIS
jgi:hypothetical protein